MRLLQICTDFSHGGIQRHVIELSESLRKQGHDVSLAGSPGPWLNRVTEFEYLSLNLLGVSAEGGRAISRILRAAHCAFELRRFLTKHRIELIHAHESAPAIVAHVASFGTGIPIVLTYHGSEPERIRYFGRVGRLTSQRVITPSHRCSQDLHEQGGVPKERIHVIGLGVRPPPSIPQDRVDKHRQKLLGADGRLLVVVIARLAHQKGIDILVEVVRKVKEARQDIRFVVIGDGPLRDEARDWTMSAGIESLLQFDGESDEPYLYLMAADLFLLTSRWEALPITIAEAFQAGLPVVATDAGGVRELVAPSAGRVLPIGDVEGLSASILEIGGDNELRRTMSDGAVKASREDRFSLSLAHEMVEHLYANVLGSEHTLHRPHS
jgi:glycosyltransferase involved in cell wall biosynthesis